MSDMNKHVLLFKEMWRGRIVGTADRMDGCDVFCSKLLLKGFSAVDVGNE